jgi:hypothetical protein
MQALAVAAISASASLAGSNICGLIDISWLKDKKQVF